MDREPADNERGPDARKVMKLDDVEFSITPHAGPSLCVIPEWRQGGLFMSLRVLMINDARTWYEVDVKALEDIELLDCDPVRLRLRLPFLHVTLSGKSAVRLMAIRHLLLPHIAHDGTGSGHEAEGSARRYYTCSG